MRILDRVALAIAAISGCVFVQAQPRAADYPTKPVTIVVPYAAGGGADVIARAVGRHLADALKQPVVVDNKPGAAGQIAATAVSRAPADGYTILLSTDNMYSINPALYGKGAKDALAGLAPVTNLVGAPVVLAVGANAKPGFRTLAEVIAAAKARNAPLTYASPGIGTPHHLIAETMARAAGIKMIHVPYKGTSAAVTDLVGGQVDLLFGMPASLQPLANAGKLRILAVTSHEVFPLLPKTPTVEQALKGVGISTVDMGLMVPAGTPQSVIQRLVDEVARVLATPDVKTSMSDNGMVSMLGTPADYAKRMQMARQEREKMIADAGIKVE